MRLAPRKRSASRAAFWRTTAAAAVIASALCAGCGHTGFVGLSEPAPPASPAKPLPIFTARDIGRPYQVLGYVFRSTEGHKSGLQPMDEHMHVLSHASEEMTELRREALARGADAVVGFEMFPTLNGWGQPIGFSVGGLAVRFVDQAPSPAAAPATGGEGPAPPSDRATPSVESKTAPLEEPEPAPEESTDAPTDGSTEAPTDEPPVLPAP